MNEMRAVGRFFKHYGAAIWLILIVPLAVWFGYRQRHDLARTWDLVVHASPGWILGVLALEASVFVMMATVYGLVLRQMGHTVRVITLLDIQLQRVVVGALTPLGGASSIAIFVHRLRQRGIRPSTSLLAASIKSVTGHVAFLLLLVPALIMREPSALIIVSAICLTFIIVSMVTMLGFVLGNRKPPPFVLRRMPRRAMRFLVQMRQHKISYRALVVPFIYSIGIKGGGVLTLFFCLKAVGFDGSFRIAIVAFVIGVVFGVMTPMFQGLGLVEIGMAVALGQMGVPGPEAVGATLLSRILGVWVPLAIGIVVQIVQGILAPGRSNADPATVG